MPATAGIHEPTREEIAVRAYLIWEKNGKPQGREQAFWLLAESELQAGYKKLTEMIATPPTVSKPKAKAARSAKPLVKPVAKSKPVKKRW